MLKFTIKRFLGMIPTMFAIITIGFFLIRVAPGGPFDAEKKLPDQVLRNIEAKYHLDKPVPVQFFMYLGNVLQGDFGPSYKYTDHDVNFYIFNSLPNSMLLGAVALFFALVFGVLVGISSALNQNTWIDYSGMGFAVIGIAVPTFVVGPVLMYVLAMKFQLLPTSGWITSDAGLKTMIMPVITLSIPYFGTIARLSRASVLEVLRSSYVRTAYAKGLSKQVVIFRHVLKGAMLPIVSFLGPAFAGIITGSIVVESIFRVPGLGKFFVQSALNRDYTLIMGVLIVYSFILIIMNFVVDIIYAFLDPRISYK
ncbi:MAG: ABC transporter permease subunit [Spirochaetaceae bacterium]